MNRNSEFYKTIVTTISFKNCSHQTGGIALSLSINQDLALMRDMSSLLEIAYNHLIIARIHSLQIEP